MFAGVSGGALIAAGGANFPDKKPWEGGKKVWYDTVFVLEKPDGAWRAVGKLLQPTAYGVSVSDSHGVICVGGSNDRRHYRAVSRLTWHSGNLSVTSEAPLPKPIANMCGAMLGDTLFIAGGTATPGATNTLKTFLALNLKEEKAQWRELEPWPGPARMLAIAAVQDGSFFLISGADLSPDADGKPVRTYLKDGYRYTPGKGWKRIADLPRAAVAAPSPAPTRGAMEFIVMSGDDAAQLATPPLQHKGFPGTTLVYNTRADRWTEAALVPAPRVTVPTAQWNGAWVVVSGEQRPGVRSPEVWSWRP